MSAIADLVTLLFSTGIPPETVAHAVELAQRHAVEQLAVSAEFHRNSTGVPVDLAAERRRAWDRERKRNSKENSTGIPPDTHIYKTPPPLTDSQRTKEVVVSRRRVSVGARIPADWQPTPEDWHFACELVGLPRAQLEFPKFKDYWQARAGPGGIKADWSATWRNWIRKAAEDGKVNGKRTIMEAADDLVDRLRALDKPAPSFDGELCGGTGEAVVRLIPKG